MPHRPTDPLHPRFDLNCDLGEGEPPARTAALLALVDSANLACGGHAGDDDTMRRGLELARRHGVRPGAHPGLPVREDFGRGPAGPLSPDQLESLLLEQVGRLARHAASLGVALHHVKLHGSLYHAVEADPSLARACLAVIAGNWPGLRVYGRAGGALECEARRTSPSVEVWPEGFLDRGYRADGGLVARGEPGAMIDSVDAVLNRLSDLRERGGCRSADGAWVSLRPKTLCLHGDGPHALEFLEAIRRVMPRPAGATGGPTGNR